jgi:hypothetical protein
VDIPNPFRAGAGHSPPYLAGRKDEKRRFAKLLEQHQITQNVVLTGLRGVGKTVLMDQEYKSIAQKKGWIWVGTDFSDHAFVSETNLSTRLLTDLSVFTSSLTVKQAKSPVGFDPRPRSSRAPLDFGFLWRIFDQQPGLVVDKLKASLEFVWDAVESIGSRGVLFAYDEAQVVRDREEDHQYPLATLLETFQSVQRKGMRYMLLLTGLPTLFPKLVESRTYAERMFEVQELRRLSEDDCREAIRVPLEKSDLAFPPDWVNLIIKRSGGYPHFLQFLCRELFDHVRAVGRGRDSSSTLSAVVDAVILRMDADFFGGRWNKLPDRQRDLLFSIASLQRSDEEFTISEIVAASRRPEAARVIKKPFRANDVSQMLPRLIESGLIYRDRHGKYLFAVPLFGAYVRRQYEGQSPAL